MPCVDSDRDRAAIRVSAVLAEERAGDSSSSDELPSISASETRTTPGGGDDWDMYRGGERDLMRWTSSSSSSSFSSSSSVEHGIAHVFSLFVFSSCVVSEPEPEAPPLPSIHMIGRRRRGGLESSTASASSGPPSNTMLLVVKKEDFTKQCGGCQCVARGR